MQISIKILNIILLCCFAQTTYSSIEKFLLEARPLPEDLKRLIGHFCNRDLPTGLASITDPHSAHSIILDSVQVDPKAPFQATGTVVTSWRVYVDHYRMNSQASIVVERSIPDIPETCNPADIDAATSSLTFTTARGRSACHTNSSASVFVFSKNSNPNHFDSIPCLKELLIRILDHPEKSEAITTEGIYICKNGKPNDDTLLEKHIAQQHITRYLYGWVKSFKKDAQRKADNAIRNSPSLKHKDDAPTIHPVSINDDIPASEDIDWSRLKTKK